MKTCPSCGSDIAEDATECLCGYTYDGAEEEIDETAESNESSELNDDADAEAGNEEGADDYAAGDEGYGDVMPGFQEPPTTKQCVFCMSEISIAAMRCPHCSGFLPIAEGTIFKQYFFFLFCSLALTIGCLLPWERSWGVMNLRGADSIAGGFLLLLAVYGMITAVWNIYHRKMIVWPILLAGLDGAIFGWSRVVQLARDVTVPTGLEGFHKIQTTIKTYATAFGPGLYLVTFFSSLVLLSVVFSVFKGAKQDAQRKADEREMRAAARKSRRPS